MSKFLIAFFALTSCALAQTYRTVTADTNNVIRTNFTIGISNVSGFPLISSGSSNAVLALNSNATQIVWSTNVGGGGGGGDLSSTNFTGVLPTSRGGTGGTNKTQALRELGIFNTNGGASLATALNSTNASTNDVGTGFAAGQGAFVLHSSVAIGSEAEATGGGAALGNAAIVYQTGSNTTRGGGAVGNRASVYNAGFAGGYLTTATDGGAIGSNSITVGGGAIGALSDSSDGGAVGFGAKSTDGFAGGKNAKANSTSNAQLGTGTNSANNTIQFLSAGTVDTNEWAALANAGSVGTNLLQAANITNAQAAIFTATTTNAPTNTNAPTPDAWLDIRVGTNDYKLPLWQ